MVMKIKKNKNLKGPSAKNGRPRILSDQDARHMARSLMSGKTKTPKKAAESIGNKATAWTARRALKKVGCFAAKKPKKPKLSVKNRKARMSFALAHQHWTIEDWKRVIWSDECKINRINSDGIRYFWSDTGRATQSHQVIETVKHGGGSLMVWGCFSYFGVGPLELIRGIMTKEVYHQILYENMPVALGQMEFPENEVIFQQDNDPKHSSKLVRNFLKTQNYETIEWPSQSPDLNPIENLWSIVKRRLGNFDEAPNSIHELWERVQISWEEIPVETCQNLIASMPKRVSATIKAKGGITSY